MWKYSTTVNLEHIRTDTIRIQFEVVGQSWLPVLPPWYIHQIVIFYPETDQYKTPHPNRQPKDPWLHTSFDARNPSCASGCLAAWLPTPCEVSVPKLKDSGDIPPGTATRDTIALPAQLGWAAKCNLRVGSRAHAWYPWSLSPGHNSSDPTRQGRRSRLDNAPKHCMHVASVHSTAMSCRPRHAGHRSCASPTPLTHLPARYRGVEEDNADALPTGKTLQRPEIPTRNHAGVWRSPSYTKDRLDVVRRRWGSSWAPPVRSEPLPGNPFTWRANQNARAS